MRAKSTISVLLVSALLLVTATADALDCYDYGETIQYTATAELSTQFGHAVCVDNGRIFATYGNTLAYYTAPSPYIFTSGGAANIGTSTTELIALAVDGNTAFVLAHDGDPINTNYTLYQVDVSSPPTFTVSSSRTIALPSSCLWIDGNSLASVTVTANYVCAGASPYAAYGNDLSYRVFSRQGSLVENYVDVGGIKGPLHWLTATVGCFITSTELRIVNPIQLSNPLSVVAASSVGGGPFTGVTTAGSMVYTMTGQEANGFAVIDASIPTQPVVLGQAPSMSATEMVVASGTLYAYRRYRSLAARYLVTQPQSPMYEGAEAFDPPISAMGTINGRPLGLVSSISPNPLGTMLVQIDPTVFGDDHFVVGNLDMESQQPGESRDSEVIGNRLYVLRGNNTVMVYDISDEANAQYLGSHTISYGTNIFYDLAAGGSGKLLIGGAATVLEYDTGSFAFIRATTVPDIPPQTNVVKIQKHGNYVYVITNTNTTRITMFRYIDMVRLASADLAVPLGHVMLANALHVYDSTAGETLVLVGGIEVNANPDHAQLFAYRVDGESLTFVDRYEDGYNPEHQEVPVDVLGREYICFGFTGTLVNVLALTNGTLQPVGYLSTAAYGTPVDLEITGAYGYVTSYTIFGGVTTRWLSILDLRDPSAPVRLKTIQLDAAKYVEPGVEVAYLVSANMDIVERQCGDYTYLVQYDSDKSTDTTINYDGEVYSSLAVDYDGDGHKDLLLCTKTVDARLFRYQRLTPNHVPEFYRTDFSVFPGSKPGQYQGHASAADYDNDGDLDVFIAAGFQSQGYLFRNHQGTVFLDETALLPTVDDGQGHQVSAAVASQAGLWADFDGAGRVGMYICRSGGEGIEPSATMPAADGVLLHNDTEQVNGAFTDVTNLYAMGSSVHAVTTGGRWNDVNLDGRLDLFVERDGATPATGAGPQLFVQQVNPGTGYWELVDEADSRLPQMGFQTSAEFADCNGDGYADLVVSSAGTGVPAASVYLNDDSGSFNWRAPVHVGAPGATGRNGVRVVDVNTDGSSDLVLWNSSSSQGAQVVLNRGAFNGYLLLEDHDGAFDVAVDHPGSAAIDDWDRDGFPDLLFAVPNAGTTNTNFYYRAEGLLADTKDVAGVVRFRLSSPAGVNNRAGIGAKVAVQYGAKTITDWIDSPAGFASSGLDVMVPATGSQDVAVDVTWPNGWVQHVQVPVSTGGNTYEIVDDTDPSLIDNSVFTSMDYDATTDTSYWVFNWETTYRSDWELDQVTLPASPCVPNAVVYTATSPGVIRSHGRLTSGRYRHTLKVPVECSAPCTIPYSVSSSHRAGITSTSTQKTFRVRFCANQL